VIRTLLVEDSVPMQVALKDLLESVGPFTVAHTATREASAALWLQDNPTAWDLAIVDLMLDDGAGFSIVRWCKTRAPVRTHHRFQRLRDGCDA
jgi:two-component system OmpR family response regulator